MKKIKYCETLKPGYYLFSREGKPSRCVYATGTTKGNKWIELDVPDGSPFVPSWDSLLWNCISAWEIERSVYYEKNPTQYPTNWSESESGVNLDDLFKVV